MTQVAGIGLRVRTARAVAVVVTGIPRDPQVLLRRELSLWDPAVPASRQPFHAGLGLSAADALPIIEPATEAVHRASRRALGDLVDGLVGQGLRVTGVALVRASDTDPSSIKNPHMHAHAAEGRLFHDALAEAAAGCRLRTVSLLEKEVLREAARRLGTREASLKRAIAELGRRVGPPWRADERSSCAGALAALSQT